MTGNGKPIWASKTIYMNVLALIATLATANGFDLGLDAQTQGTIVAGVMAIVNIILRLVTSEPIKRPGDAGGGTVNSHWAGGLLLLALLGLMLTGCAAFTGGQNAPQAQTPRQHFAQVQARFDMAVDTATDLVRQDIITGDTAAQVGTEIDRGYQVISAARDALEAGDLDSAEAQARLLNGILLRLNAQITEAKHDGS